MHGTQYYPEGQYRPEKVTDAYWHVWCATGAVRVLEDGEYEKCLEQCPSGELVISFANGSAARIQSQDALWRVLTRLSETYVVEVFQLGWEGPYVPWNGSEVGRQSFDAIKLKRRTS